MDKTVEIVIHSKKHGTHTVLIDEEDFDLISQYEWHLQKSEHTFYVGTEIKTEDGKRTTVTMHRLLLGAEGGIVRRKNLNGLDNRRINIEKVIKPSKRDRSGERFSTYRRSAKQIETACASCGITMFMAPSYFSASKVACCSRECYAARAKAEGIHSGENSGNWKGGIIFNAEGRKLVKCPDHPNANCLGYVYNYRLVMEKMIGRFLTPEEVVHHIDDDPTNDDPSNLVLCANQGEHRRLYHRGEHGHTSHKLSKEERAELQKRLLAGETQMSLAKEFNVSQSRVSQLKIAASVAA